MTLSLASVHLSLKARDFRERCTIGQEYLSNYVSSRAFNNDWDICWGDYIMQTLDAWVMIKRFEESPGCVTCGMIQWSRWWPLAFHFHTYKYAFYLSFFTFHSLQIFPYKIELEQISLKKKIWMLGNFKTRFETLVISLVLIKGNVEQWGSLGVG